VRIDGVPIKQIAKKYGTPTYAYSAASLIARYKQLEIAFAGFKTTICYALKANPNISICKLLARCGAGADIVSGGELKRALRAGFKTQKILFSGVGKTSEELTAAVKNNIGAIHIESSEELEVLEGIAKRARKSVRIAIRVNPNVMANTHKHIATGSSQHKFGVLAEEALELYKKAEKSPVLKPVGIHCHLGSQIKDVKPYKRAIIECEKILRVLEQQGIVLEYIDLGGGMSIDFNPRILAAAMRPFKRRHKEMHLLLEPGRWLVAASGTLITKVLYNKKSGNKRFVIVDAGMNDLIRPALYNARHRIVPVEKNQRKKVRVDVVGPNCETADTLARGIILRETKRGEYLAILDVGAYGSSMSSQYNTRPRASELLVSRGKVRTIRRRETHDDLMRPEIII